MSDKMNKLKEIAGENVLDTEMLDLIAGGNRAQTEELWNFFMSHGAGGFLKKYEKDHAKGVLEALKMETESSSLHGTYFIANARSKKGGNVYKCHNGDIFSHGEMMKFLKRHYESGHGHFSTLH